MKSSSVLRSAAMIAVAFLSLQSYAQDSLRQTLFEDAKDALVAANKVQASILAPVSYAEGAEHYKKAESVLERGGSIDRIKTSLEKATAEWQKSVKSTEIARLTLSASIQARMDALSADAKTYAADAWNEAEKLFNDAATNLEKGSLRNAQRSGQKAEAIYREAELTAIKANYLTETLSLLSKAEKLKAKRFAPATLARAQSLYLEAEKELTENRYDTDRPRSLAADAKHQANAAIYLAQNLARVYRKYDLLEEFVLDWQTPVTKIGAALDIPVYFDNGYEQPLALLITRINELLETNLVQGQELQEKKARIRDMEKQIAGLESRLGGASQERMALAAQLDQQARIKAKFATVESMFGRDEAIVRRAGNDIIMRMVGLTFDSGQAVISPDRFPLLDKVKNAIDQFSDGAYLIEVEGHTDAFGSDETNLALSTERAAAVKSYMHNYFGIQESLVKAVGYGEARPIANNETREGRAKNRRIDILIRPSL